MIYVHNKSSKVTIKVSGPKVGTDVPTWVHGWLIFDDTSVAPCVVIDGMLTPLMSPAVQDKS